jgi:hypothetical protein
VPALQNKRYGLFAAFAFGQGTTLGPLVALALAVSPGILMTAVLSTAAVFASFTLSALLTKRRCVSLCACVCVCSGYMHVCTLGCVEADATLPPYCVGAPTSSRPSHTHTHTHEHTHTHTHTHTHEHCVPAAPAAVTAAAAAGRTCSLAAGCRAPSARCW